MDGEVKRAGSSLDAVAAAFQARVAELQDLILARNMYAATAVPDLAAVDAALTTMEAQVEAIRRRLHEERDAIPKAKRLVEQSQRQQRKLQHMLAHMPSGMLEGAIGAASDRNPSRMFSDCLDFSSVVPDVLDCDLDLETLKIKEEPVAAPKKGKGVAPRWYISAEELDSLSSYMKGRLTLEKVNIAINEVATYADANAHLVACPKKKLSEDTWEKALELRDIAATEAVKGKHFFLETDIKGPGLKLDNTGKAILTTYTLSQTLVNKSHPHPFFYISKDASSSRTLPFLRQVFPQILHLHFELVEHGSVKKAVLDAVNLGPV